MYSFYKHQLDAISKDFGGDNTLKTKVIYSLTAVVIIFSASIHAQTFPLRGGTCWGITSSTLSPTMTFNCQHLGKVTISEIYEKGFRVVSSLTHTSIGGTISLIIEEQRH